MSSIAGTPKIPPYIPPYLRRRKLSMDSADCSVRDVQKFLKSNQARQIRSFRSGELVKTAKSAQLSDSLDSFEELINIVQQPRRSVMPGNDYSSAPGGSSTRPAYGPLQLQDDSGRNTGTSMSSHQYEDIHSKFTEVGDNLKKMADALDIEKGCRFGRRDHVGMCCKAADTVSKFPSYCTLRLLNYSCLLLKSR